MAKSKSPKKLEYRQLSTNGQAALIEYIDQSGIHRCIIPLDQIGEEGITPELVELAVPYGEKWAEIIELQATPEKFEQELYKAGIWTVADLRKNPRLIVSILQAVYGLDVTKLIQKVREMEGVK